MHETFDTQIKSVVISLTCILWFMSKSIHHFNKMTATRKAGNKPSDCNFWLIKNLVAMFAFWIHNKLHTTIFRYKTCKDTKFVLKHLQKKDTLLKHSPKIHVYTFFFLNNIISLLWSQHFYLPVLVVFVVTDVLFEQVLNISKSSTCLSSVYLCDEINSQQLHEGLTQLINTFAVIWGRELIGSLIMKYSRLPAV